LRVAHVLASIKNRSLFGFLNHFLSRYNAKVDTEYKEIKMSFHF
jgi:hypothetical protein